MAENSLFPSEKQETMHKGKVVYRFPDGKSRVINWDEVGESNRKKVMDILETDAINHGQWVPEPYFDVKTLGPAGQNYSEVAGPAHIPGDPWYVKPETGRMLTSMTGQATGEELGAGGALGAVELLTKNLPQSKLLKAVKVGSTLLGGMAGAGLGQKEAQRIQTEAGLAPDQQTPTNAAMWAGGGRLAGIGLGWSTNAIKHRLALGRTTTEEVRKTWDLYRKYGIDPNASQVVGPGMYRSVIEWLYRHPFAYGRVSDGVELADRQLISAMEEQTKVRLRDSILSQSDYAPKSYQGKRIASGDTDYIEGYVKNPDTSIAGAKLDRRIEDYHTGFKQRSSQLYEEFYDLAGNVELKPEHFRTFLEQSASKEPVLRRITNQKSAKLLKDLYGEYAHVKKLPDGTKAYVLKNIDFETVKKIRSRLGEFLSTPLMQEDFARKEVKQMYKALTNDMRGALKGDALRAFDVANNYFARGSDILGETIAKINKKVTPTEVFKSVESVIRSGDSRHLNRIKNLFKNADGTINEREWEIVRNTWMNRVIMAGGGHTATPEVFVREWASLPDNARKILAGTEARQNLDELYKIAQNHWVPENRPNPLFVQSQMASAGRGGADLASGALPALFGGSAVGAATGNPILGLLTAAMSIAGPGFTARKLFDPKFTKWLAEGAQVEANHVGAHIGKLASLYGNADQQEQDEIRAYLNALKVVTEQGKKPELPSGVGGLDALGH